MNLRLVQKGARWNTSSWILYWVDYTGLAMRLDETLLYNEGPSNVASLGFDRLERRRWANITSKEYLGNLCWVDDAMPYFQTAYSCGKRHLEAKARSTKDNKGSSSPVIVIVFYSHQIRGHTNQPESSRCSASHQFANADGAQ